MGNVRRRSLLLLLVLVPLAGTFVVVQGRATRRALPDGVDRGPAVEPETPLPRLQGDASAGTPPAANAREEARAIPDDAEETSGPPVWLRGTIGVEGRDEEVRFARPLTVSVGSQATSSDSVQVFPVETTVDRTGPFALDLRKPLEHLAARYRVEDLRVTVDDPDYMPICLVVPIPDPAAVLRGRATIDDLPLTLHEASVLRGVLYGADGEPVVDALVLLYRFEGDDPQRTPLSTEVTRRDGAFALRYARDGRHLVVALWRGSDDWERSSEAWSDVPPASAELDLRVDTPAEPVHLAFDSGYGLRGVVRHEGRPVAHADVVLEPVVEGSSLFLPGDPVWASGLIWTGSRVLSTKHEVDTDAEGRFELDGLPPLPCRLRIGHAEGLHPHTRAEGRLVQEVTPPRGDVVFDLALARLEVRVVSAGRPLPEVAIGVTDVGMAPDIGDVMWRTSWLETDEHGRAVCLLSPKCTYYLTVEDDDRFEVFEHEFETPAAGETHRIVAHMQPLRPRPALAVTFEGAGAEAVEIAGFGFRPPDIDPRSESPWPLRAVVVRDDDGVFRLADLEPGSWRLHVRPGRGWYGDPGAWVEAVCAVEIPESGETRLPVTIEQGGRLHLHVTDRDGRHLKASCRILDEREAEVPAHFVATDALGGGCRSTRTLPGIGPCWVEPVLQPGTYRVLVEAEGYRSSERQVTLQPGLPTSVRVVLERRE